MAVEHFVREKLRQFLAEDIGPGDLTTDSIPALALQPLRATINARRPGVLAGVDFALEVFRLLDPTVQVNGPTLTDGSPLSTGQTIARISGQAAALLKGERTALNILQRLSGIATLTRRYADALQGSRTLLLDTRKTTPGFRYFEKHAVRAGGGANHRLGLFDGAMIKDNHIAAAGGIGPVVDQLRRRIPVTVRIEVEVDTLDQVEEALAAGADIIMLDNMTPAQMREALRRIDGRSRVEASGGIALDDLPELAGLGLDYISTSAIITQARWLDIGMDITE
ncbi:MAG: carboxylating nicotinate-nucleotide diphosphorylase [Acidobacteria bacterium]|nr:carboxylating nicotinate-nucleotide diphosphorylase [Acidobacteriota bacterium]